MYLLYCDETNFEKKPGDFFVYGGLIIPPDTANLLSAGIEQLRADLKVPTDYVFKFNPGPKSLSHDGFIALKKGVIELAVKHNVKLLVNLLLHDIARSSDVGRRFGINTLCYHYDCYLNRPKAYGVMLIDRFNDKHIDGQLQEKLSVGLKIMTNGHEVKIERVLGFHYAAIGQSHFCSLVDVVLGSLRFAINAFTQGNKEHQASAEAILKQVAPLFYFENGVVSPISLWFSPATVTVLKYKKQYIALKDYLAGHGIKVTQSL